MIFCFIPLLEHLILPFVRDFLFIRDKYTKKKNLKASVTKTPSGMLFTGSSLKNRYFISEVPLRTDTYTEKVHYFIIQSFLTDIGHERERST
jgi:hypothetical protein